MIRFPQNIINEIADAVLAVRDRELEQARTERDEMANAPARLVTLVRKRAERAEAERDGAYRERAQLLAWLAALHPAVIAPAPDTNEDGWQILYLWVGDRQASWHIAPRDAELFEHVEHVLADDRRAQWDGHTTEQKYEHIREHTRDRAAARRRGAS